MKSFIWQSKDASLTVVDLVKTDNKATCVKL